MTDLVPGRKPLSADLRKKWEERGLTTRVAVARKARGVPQEKAANALGISVSTLRRWEKGKLQRPDLGYYVNAALLYDVPLSSLIDDAQLAWTVLDKDTPRGPNRDLWNTSHKNPDPPPAP